MNTLYFGDCLEVLQKLHGESKEGFIDLVYIDPPFNSKRDYNILFEEATHTDTKAQKEAFSDTWSNVSYKDTIQQLKDNSLALSQFLEALDHTNISKSTLAYLSMMAIRIVYIHKVLKDTGSFYLHADPTMSHYLKIVCDMIFGSKNFRNEIVWCYRGAGYPKQDFGKRHDVILRYSKTEKYIFNLDAVREPYATATVERFKHHIGNVRDGIDYGTQELNPLGRHPDDWWEIQPIAPSAKERLGYPTQKPLVLIEKIIKASCPEGGLVADFFCGCGTTIAAAEKLGRRWIGVDISHLAIGLIERKRLIEPFEKSVNKPQYQVFGLPKDLASAKQLAEETDKGRLKFQDWVIETKLGGIANPKKTADGGWDGHITFEHRNKKEAILIEVKSGKVSVKTIRELAAVVAKQGVAMGALVCFKDAITQPMLLEAKEAGYFEPNLWGTRYDKLQIITIEDLIANQPALQYPSKNLTFKPATAHTTDLSAEQGTLEV